MENKTEKNNKQKHVFFVPAKKGWEKIHPKEIKTKIVQLAFEGKTFAQIADALGISPALLYKMRKSDLEFERDVLRIMEKKRKEDSEVYILSEAEKEEVERQRLVGETEGPFRPTSRLTGTEIEQAVDEVCKGIRFGLELDYACMRASISKKTIKELMRDDKEIMFKINRARADNMAWWVDKIRKGAEKNWRAAVVYLERIFPHIWGEVKQVEIKQRQNDGFSPDIIDVTAVDKSSLERIKLMSNEELLQMEQKLSLVETMKDNI